MLARRALLSCALLLATACGAARRAPGGDDDDDIVADGDADSDSDSDADSDTDSDSDADADTDADADADTDADADADADADGDADCTAGVLCNTGLGGPCALGHTVCVNHVQGCDADEDPGVETCANAGVDDDCNLTVDDVQEVGTDCIADDGGPGRFHCVGADLVCQTSSCENNPIWRRVDCATDQWVWSSDRAIAMDLQTANEQHVLWTGCSHAAVDGCSLDGTGWVTVDTIPMAGCNDSWYHIGGAFTGNCGGHDGDLVRRLVLGDDECYDF